MLESQERDDGPGYLIFYTWQKQHLISCLGSPVPPIHLSGPTVSYLERPITDTLGNLLLPPLDTVRRQSNYRQ